jgi:hypothetical protein
VGPAKIHRCSRAAWRALLDAVAAHAMEVLRSCAQASLGHLFCELPSGTVATPYARRCKSQAEESIAGWSALGSLGLVSAPHLLPGAPTPSSSTHSPRSLGQGSDLIFLIALKRPAFGLARAGSDCEIPHQVFVLPYFYSALARHLARLFFSQLSPLTINTSHPQILDGHFFVRCF